MFRWTTLRLISEKWAVCSAQLQSLIVDGQNDASGKIMQSARGFLRDVDLERVIVETDDALDLLYYMQRVDYPKGSKLETNASEWLQRHSDTFDVSQLGLMCQYAMEKEQRNSTSAAPAPQTSGGGVAGAGGNELLGVRRPPHIAAIGLWYRTVIQRSWFRARIQEWVNKLDLGGLVAFAKVISWSWEAAAAQARRAGGGGRSGTGGDIGEHQQTSSAGEDTSYIQRIVCIRSAALLRETVVASTSAKKKHSSSLGSTPLLFVVRDGVHPVTLSSICEMAQYVLPTSAAEACNETGDIFLYIDAHIRRLSSKDATKLAQSIASASLVSTFASSRVIMSLMGHFALRVATTPTSPAEESGNSLLSSGTLLGQSALKVLQGIASGSSSQEENHSEQVRFESGLESHCTILAQKCLPPSLVEAELTPDAQEGLLHFVSLLVGVQECLGRPLAVIATLQPYCKEHGASVPLQMLVASYLQLNEEVGTLWAAWCGESSIVATPNDEKAIDKKGHNFYPSPAGAKCAIRALALVFLRDDSTAFGHSQTHHPWLKPGSAALQRSMRAIHLCALSILEHHPHAAAPAMVDLCSLMYVQTTLEERNTISVVGAIGEGGGDGHVAATDRGGSSSHRRGVVEQLLQRIAHSSKFSFSSTAGTAGGTASSALSQPSVSSLSWNMDVARMVIHSAAASSCGMVLQSYPTVMEMLHRVFQEEVEDVQRSLNRRPVKKEGVDVGRHLVKRRKGLTVGSCSALLLALSDAQLTNTAMARNVVQIVVLRAPWASAEELARCLTVLPIVNMRDIHAACTLMRELREREPLPFLCVVEAADAARRLRIAQHFQQCKVSERVTDLRLPAKPMVGQPPSHTPDRKEKEEEGAGQYLPLEMFSVLVSACTVDEQRRLFTLAQNSFVSGASVAEQPNSPKSPPSKKTRVSPQAAQQTSIASAYLAVLPSFLLSRPTTALMLLACPECPPPFLQCVGEFLKTALPLPSDDVDSSSFLASIASVDEMLSKLKLSDSSSAERTAQVECLSQLFTDLVVFGTEAVLRLDESSLALVVAAATRVHALPNRIFRVLGRRIGSIADGMTPENALNCLDLYATYKIRDDRVVKALLTRCIFTIGMIGGSIDLSARLRRVCEAYPHWSHGASQALQKYGTIKARRERRMM